MSVEAQASSPVSSAPATGAVAAPANGATPSSPMSLTERIQQLTTQRASAANKDPAKPMERTADGSGPQNPPEPVTGEATPPKAEEGEQKNAGTEAGEKKIVEYGGRKFDFTQPEKVAKKLVDLEQGMRKFQTERDQLRKELETAQGSIPDPAQKARYDLVDNVRREIDAAMKAGVSPSAMVDVVLPKFLTEDVINSWLQQKLRHHSHLLSLNPQEKEAYLKQFQERQDWEKEKIRVAMEKDEIEKFKQERETLEVRTAKAELEAVVTPGYREAAFKLPNKKMEQALNQQLWNEGKNKIKEFIAEGYEVTGDNVREIFRIIKAELEDGMNLAAEEKVQKKVAEKKQAAMTGISQAVQTGGQPAESIDDMLKRGASMEDTFTARIRNAMKRRS